MFFKLIIHVSQYIVTYSYPKFVVQHIQSHNVIVTVNYIYNDSQRIDDNDTLCHIQ